MSWDPGQYLKFRKERTQPSADLINRIKLSEPKRVIDIGCGPGNSTKMLRKRYPKAKITGIDNSEEMIKTASKNHPDISFSLCDASKELSAIGEKFDIVFSNACIQWIPDHNKLLREMYGLLNEGGVMAVQVPMNFSEPIHRIISERVNSEKWQSTLSGTRIFHTLSPEEYYGILAEISENFSMWQTVYFHRMRSHSDIMEWYKGTGLRPYLDRLDKREAAEFEGEILERINEEYPVLDCGEIIFKFPRLFFTAEK
ncbi:MAG: methyltransferase domain-containing protein [Ruminococcus sp.]|nr:methyltransferase domain-containing protein [Ruminococcus sp.]